ncbi:MAG: hypothetical protein PVH85_01660 [Desulfobacterales bacterium]
MALQQEGFKTDCTPFLRTPTGIPSSKKVGGGLFAPHRDQGQP